MRASETLDRFYTDRPIWSVEGRLPASDAQTPPSPVRIAQHSNHKKIIFAAGVVTSLALAAISLGYKQDSNKHVAPVNMQPTTVRNNAVAPKAQAPEAPVTQEEVHSSSTSATVDSQSASTTNNGSVTNHSNTQVTINGQSVPVPPSGTIHKTYADGNSHSTVDITVQNSTTSN